MKEFELRIETAKGGLDLLQQGWPTRAISLVGEDLRFHLPCFGPHHHIARFHDIEAPQDGYVAPDKETLRAALAHGADIRSDERLLIHCHAGKSRSPALAIAVLVANGATPADALKRVKGLRPFVIPNRLMISLLDEILELRGDLVRLVLEHYSSLPPDASLPNRGNWNL